MHTSRFTGVVLDRQSQRKYFVRITPPPPVHAGAEWLESSFAEEAPGVLVDTTLNLSEQRALAAEKASSVLGCIRQGTACRSREVIHLLGSAGLEQCIQSCDPQNTRDEDVLESPVEGQWW